ncbi:hypothetical protein PbJCM13498_29970 [Prolixibacter bellariivorans]|uniref:Peptidase M16 n=1 Tax=Prolixibacter bellariivorans TaxID=314319 RepID=A0A5M4B236_9BACT|nr:pitrilysin family protein [Prolixibacter bellariivorans]GET34134.1 hypothetical protein PbJCM13498_29970 [Prolixibacter bellariivorans]
MKKKAFLVLSFFLVLSVAKAQKPSNFYTTKLSNGLEVLVIEDHSVPLATVEITTKNGSYTEPPEFNGLSHLYEHMFFKANKDYPSQEAFMAKVHELGIAFNGTTGNERVNYFFTLPKSKWTDGLHFMNSAIRYPLFLSKEIKKENIVVDGEFQRLESNPFFLLSDSMKHVLWGNLYSRKNPIGIHHIIRTATPEKMHTIQHKYYWPNNSMLIVSGDVNHKEVFAKVKDIFSSWKPSDFDPFKKWPIPEFQPLDSTNYFVVTSPYARVPIMMLEWQGPDTRRDVHDTYVADVFSTILSQNSSKFQKMLVDSGLALQANVGYQTLKYTGPISAIVVPNPTKVAACAEAVKKQISMWDSPDYITDQQLENAKRQLEINHLQESDVTSDLSHTMAYFWCSASLDYYYNYIPNIKKVTKQDLINYVDKYIKDKPYAAGLLINTKSEALLHPATFWKK